MPPDATAADNGALTIEQAGGLLSAEQPIEETNPQTAQQEATPQAEAAPDAPQEPESETETDGQDADPEAQLPPLQAPQSWNAEARKEFEALPRAAQQIIAARETERDTAVSKALLETTAQRKIADEEAARFSQTVQVLTQVLPVMVTRFANKWDGWDFRTAIQQYGTDEALIQRDQRDQDYAQLQQIVAVQQQSGTELQNRFNRAQVEAMPNVAQQLGAPELLDQQHRNAIVSFALSRGVQQDELPNFTAVHWGIANDAMKYRELIASGKLTASRPQAQTTQPAAQQQRQPTAQVRPTAAPATRTNPTRRAVSEAETRLAKTGRIDDAIALLNARGSGQ